jgi:uncharacterized protein (DUF305 family)
MRSVIGFFSGMALLGAVAGAGEVSAPGEGQGDKEKSFLAMTQAAMGSMMAGMQAAPRGDVDQDFIAQMVPHHQGAIDMARAELRYGRNEQLRRIAQEIIVEQQAEITVMQQERAPGPETLRKGAG